MTRHEFIYSDKEFDDLLKRVEHDSPGPFFEDIAKELKRLKEIENRYIWISYHARCNGGGHGCLYTFFVPVDHEDMGCAIDEAIEKEKQEKP